MAATGSPGSPRGTLNPSEARRDPDGQIYGGQQEERHDDIEQSLHQPVPRLVKVVVDLHQRDAVELVDPGLPDDRLEASGHEPEIHAAGVLRPITERISV